MSKKAANRPSGNMPQLLVCAPQTDQPACVLLHLTKAGFHTTSLDHPEMHVYGGEKSLSIDDVRQIERDCSFQPLHDITWVIILHSDQASLPAQQALLKMLEEPPVYVQWVLVTDQPTSLLPTIHSRCVIIDQKETNTSKQDEHLSEAENRYRQLQTASVGEALAASDIVSDREAALQLLSHLVAYLHRQPATAKTVRDMTTIIRAKQDVAANVNLKLAMGECFLALRMA